MTETETDVVAPRRATLTLGTAQDNVVLACAVLLCIGFAPAFVAAPYSVRFVVLLGLLPIGLVTLALLCIRRDVAAIAASAFVGVAVVSSLASKHVRISLLGQVGKESSALLLAAFFCCWALGRRLTERGRALLPYALLIGLGINAFDAFLQMAFPSDHSQWSVPSGGRALGLTASPVQLGALMAAGVGLCAAQALVVDRRWHWWAGGCAVFAAATNLSGTRVALLSIGAVLVALSVVHRAWLRTAVAAAAVAIGVVVSSVALATSTSNGGTGTGSHVATARATVSFDRKEAWILGLRSFLHHPVLGYGPGGFRGATQGRYSAAFVRTVANDERLSAWFDAHNVIIEFLVATGIVGVLLLAVFVWKALRAARGPLVAAAVAIALTWLMQPLSISDAPIAFLALGAASTGTAVAVERHAASARRIGAGTVAAVLGVLLAAGYAFVDLRLQAAVNSGDAVRIENAARPFGEDAVVADIVAQGWANAYLFEHADKRHLQTWALKVVEREPDRPYWWSKLASTQMNFGDTVGARTSLDHAIALQPWSPSAWPLMLELAKRTKDSALEATARAKVCELQLRGCKDA